MLKSCSCPELKSSPGYCSSCFWGDATVCCGADRLRRIITTKMSTTSTATAAMTAA